MPHPLTICISLTAYLKTPGRSLPFAHTVTAFPTGLNSNMMSIGMKNALLWALWLSPLCFATPLDIGRETVEQAGMPLLSLDARKSSS